MTINSIDIDSMLKELEMLYKEFNIPKMMAFVPDKLEIVLERTGEDTYHLIYSEFFNYLPDSVLETSRDNVIQFLQQLGFSSGKIHQLENGIKVQITSNSQITLFPILELLFQSKSKDVQIKSILDSINKNYQLFTKTLDFHWNWTNETARKYTILTNIVKEHPSIIEKLNKIVMKYTSKKRQ